MADRGMKALLVDEEAEGPSDRPMRLVRADDAGAPPSSRGAGQRASTSASALRGSATTLASSTPPRSPKATMGTSVGEAPGFGAVRPTHAGASVGYGNSVSNSGPPPSMSPKPTMGKPAGEGSGYGSVRYTPVDATRNLLNVDHTPHPGSPTSTVGKPAGGGSGLSGVHYTQVDASRDLLNGGHPHHPSSPTSSKPTTGTHAGVVPGLGAVHPSHVGASVGLVNGVSHHAITNPHWDPTLHHIAHAAQHDPARWGGDLLLRGHNPRQYEDLVRAGRLPSHVWAHHEGTGRLGEHLRAVDARFGEELRWLHRHRPVGERALLGIAAATGVHDAIARALDAMRVHPHYPARASFGRLMYGFEQQDVARIASAFLVRGHEQEYVIEQYRILRERLELAHLERRRRLLRRLREQWAGRGVTLVPMFASVTEGYSPAQIERLRFELARGGEIEATFEAIERANVQARLASSQAAFRRWMAEWHASRQMGAQTPLQEPQTILLTTPPPPRPTIIIERRAAPVEVIEQDEPEVEPVEDAAPDSSPRLVVQDPADDAETPDEEEPAEGPDEPSERDEAGYLRVLRAPAPGAHAADGVLPWPHLTQGFRRRDEEALGRAWTEGRPWDAYHEILERTAQETTAEREAEFCRRVETLGCPIHGPCQLPSEQLAALAHLGAHFAPEQWSRIAAALTEGTDDPLEVWRAIERENVAEAVAVREPAFLQHLSAWGDAPGRWNPAEWRRWAPHLRRAVRDGEASGLHDELGGALGSGDVGEGSDVAGSVDASFGDDAAGDLGALGSTLGGLTTSALNFGGSGAGDLGGELGNFARQAVEALHGNTRGRGAASGGEASGVPEDDSSALGDRGGDGGGDIFGSPSRGDTANVGAGGDVGALERTLGGPATSPVGSDAGALYGNAPWPGTAPLPDLGRIVAPWGNNPLAQPIVRALLGLGLPEIATAPPWELLRLIPSPFPQPNTEPNGWWRALTAVQGLDEAAQKALRATIDADGPSGIQHTIAVYRRLLQGPSEELMARREALFARILREAQNLAGPAFNPAALPGGDPFVLLAQNMGTWAWVRDAILSGQDPLGAFHRAETERQNGCFQDASSRMATMLEALWNARRAAGWMPGNEAGEPGEAGDVRYLAAPSVRREPMRDVFRREPERDIFRREPERDIFRREVVRAEPAYRTLHDYRPRPLYHLSFGRPMSHRELGRILRVVPSLQAHPEGVLREMAGLSGQALDVRGVDATTGEYLLTPGETFADIALKLVGDRARWRELEATNPLRAEGDVRVRLPPGWFGYVPYAIPRRPNAGAVAAAVLGGPLVAIGSALAGLFHPRHHYRFLGPVAGRWFGHRYPHRFLPLGAGSWFGHQQRGFGPVAGLFEHHRHHRGWDAAGPDDVSGEESDEAGAMYGGGGMHGGGSMHGGSMHGRGGRGGRGRGGRGFWGGGTHVVFENAPDDDAEDASEARSYVVTPDDAREPLSPRYTRQVAAKIAGQIHGLYDGREWLRPDWWAELREVNPQKPLASNGWWRDIHEGENLWIPGYWPMPDSESPSDAGDPLDFLRELNPFGQGVPAAKVPAQHSRLDEPTAPPPAPDYSAPPPAWNPANFGEAARRNSGPRQNLTTRTYVVKRGDWPVRIAKAYGATARPHWLTELQRANPHKPVDDGIGNWFYLNAGETINVPDAWGTGSIDTGEEAAGPDERWVSLGEIEGMAPYFAPLARYFRATNDPEGFWRGYGDNLAPHFERVVPGNSREAILEISSAGFYMAIPGASGPVGWRKATVAELHHFQSGVLRQIQEGGLTFWVEPAFGVEPVPSNEPDTGADDAGALTDRENLTQQTYAVHRGDGMVTIAKKFGAATRPHWFAELRDANPTKAIAVNPTTGKQVGWQRLNPGDIVNIPDVWAAADSLHARPAPGGSPSPAPYLGLQTFPPLPEHGAYPSPTAPPGTTPAAALVDPGTILRVQGILVAFRQAHPTEVNPANFGDGLPVSPDCLGVMTPRTQQALSSFQTWTNKQGRYPLDERRGLRTDGMLDPATIAALDSFSAQALGGLTQRPPVLTIPGALPPRRVDATLVRNGIDAATTAAEDFARAAAVAAPGAVTDQWADLFQASAPTPGPDIPPRKPGVPAPLHELPEVLDRNGAPGVPSLPPGAPHGPRGPRRARPEATVPTTTLQVPPDVYDRFDAPGTLLPEETPPARLRDEKSPARPRDEKPPAQSRKDNDGVLLPMALAGLSVLSGVI